MGAYGAFKIVKRLESVRHAMVHLGPFEAGTTYEPASLDEFEALKHLEALIIKEDPKDKAETAACPVERTADPDPKAIVDALAEKAGLPTVADEPALPEAPAQRTLYTPPAASVASTSTQGSTADPEDEEGSH